MGRRGSGRGAGGLALILTAVVLGLVEALAPSAATSGIGDGGTYRRPLAHDPATLDPAQLSDIYGLSVSSRIFDGLVQFDQTLAIAPALAQFCRASRDGLTWTFVLRRGVRFHHGRELTAEDVVYSLTRLLDPRLKSGAADLFAGIRGATEFREGRAARVAGLTALDSHTVQVALAEAPVPLVSLLAVGHAKIVPREVVEERGERFGVDPVGTGPFRLVRWERRNEIVLAANPDYFAGAPRLSRVVYRIFPGTQVDEMYAEFSKGELEDSPVPIRDYRQAIADPRHVYVKRPMISVRFYGFNTRLEPFGDRRVRQAMAHAIDRNAVIEEAFLGRYVSARGILPPGTLGFNPRVTGYAYDPRRARDLLSEAGYPQGRGLPRVPIWSAARHAGILREHDQVRRNLEAVGIRAEFHYQTDWPTFSKLLNDGKLPVFLYAWFADVPDPDNFLYKLFYSRSPRNFFGYANPAVDELLLRARREGDMARRVELYRQAEELILEDAPIIPVWHYTYERLFQPYVRSVEVNGLGDRTSRSGRSGWRAGPERPVARFGRRLPFVPLQARPLLGTALVLLLVMAAVIAVVEQRQRATIVEEVKRRGEVIAASLAATSTGPLLLYNFTALEQNVARVAREADVVYAIVLDADGAVAAHSARPDRVGTRLAGPVDERAARAERPLVQESRDADGEALYDFAVPVRVDGQKWGTIRVGLSRRRMEAEIAATRRELAGLTAAALVLGALAAAVVARRIARPVRELAEGVAAISRGELDQRIEPATADEIGQLALAFNHMAAQLLQQRTALEAAHAELRGRFEELADLKHYTDSILSSLTSGIVTLDLDGRVVTLNPAAELLTGLFAPEVTGRYCTEALAHSPELVEVLMETLASRSGVAGVALPLRRRNGSLLTVEVSTAPLKGVEGKDLGVVGVLRDITPIRELEAQLRRSDRLAALGTLAAGLAHEIKNPLTSLRTFTRLAPRKLEDERFRRTFETVVPRELDRINAIVERLLQLARPARLRPAPVRLPVLLEHVLELYATQLEARQIAVEREYDPAVPAVQADAEHLYQAFVNLVSNALDAMGPGGRLTLRVTWSDGPEGLPPIARRSAPRRARVDIQDTGPGIPPEIADRVFNPFFTTKDAGTGLGLALTHKIVEDHGGTVTFRTAAGAGTPSASSSPSALPPGSGPPMLRGRPSADDGRPASAVPPVGAPCGAEPDALDRRELLRAETLARIAGGIAHSFNNVLSVILGRMDLLLGQVERGGLPPAELQKGLRVIRKAALDAGELLRRFRELARPAQGAAVAVFDLNGAVQDTHALLQPHVVTLAQARGVRLRVRLQLGTPPVLVAGQPSALREVLVNLILNALDAMPAGGEVTVETRVEAGRVLLRVADTGVGMSPEVRARAFAPFFTTKGPGHSGLGLSSARELVAAHGGSITLDSREGHGTTVTIVLPAAAPPGPAAAPPTPPLPPGLRVLVIDDEPEVAQLLAELLESRGCMVSTAHGGRAALARLEQGGYDLVITDLLLPEVPGWELARVAKRQVPGAVVVAVSGDLLGPDELRVAGPAIDAFLQKPVDFATLLRRLAELAGRAARPES